MPLRNILKIIMSHPQFGPQIINKLADSRPIRWAARLTASMYLRGKYAIEQKINDPKVPLRNANPLDKDNYTNFSGNRFKNTFVKELKREWENTKNKRK